MSHRTLRVLSSAVLLMASSLPALAQKPAPAPDSLVRMNESMDALTRKVWPSVVQIQVTSYTAREQQLRKAVLETGN